MIEFHNIVSAAVAPVKVRPASSYINLCTLDTEASLIEVADIDQIIVPSGCGTGIIFNPLSSRLILFHLGRALTLGPWKINNLPSACDLIIHSDQELMIAELTESNPRSVLGVVVSQKPGKMEKAKKQMKATVSYIEQAYPELNIPKRTAIFFFRFPDIQQGVAAKTMNAFTMRPTLRTVTIYYDSECPDWEFRNHPYPFPYSIS